MKLQTAFDLFIKAQTAQNKSATVQSYIERTKTFREGFGPDLYHIATIPPLISDQGLVRLIEGHGEREIGKITPVDVDDWLIVLKNQTLLYVGNARPNRESGLSKATIEGRKQALKAFFLFCEDRGYVERSPARHIRKASVRKASHVKEKTMNPYDFYKLMDVAIARDKRGNSRDLALLCLMADSGIRPGEAIALDVPNISLDRMEGQVINGKTGDRIVVFSVHTAKALEKYLVYRRLILSLVARDTQALFLGLHYPNLGRRLKRDAINSLFARLRKEAGIEGICNPYSIRHMVGDNLAMRAGVALPLVQEILGHVDINTTMNYVHPDMSQLKGIVALHSLLNNYFRNGA